MSFVDLASLAFYDRNEMAASIGVFVEKCDHAIRNVNKLKMQAQGFVENFNCGVASESDLKERFLNCLEQLDEFTYFITDFNLAMSKFDSTTSIDYTPVQDTSSVPVQSQLDAYNLIDTLSEPIPSTSKEHSKCQEKSIPKKRKIPKNNQLLIEFSSTSCSSESVPTARSEKEVQCHITEELKNLTLDNSHILEECKLPAQTILQIDHVYPATVMSTDGISFWVITDEVNEVLESFVDLASLAFYRRNEMAARIGVFVEKCDHAIRNVNKLKMQAQGFVENFNCGVASESDLKERFLNCLKQLDEFTYFITDFNLAMSKFDSTTSIDYTPVQDTSSVPVQSQLDAYNLIDTLSEPIPSTSKEHSKCQEKSIPKKRKIPKNNQLLIEFSSTSCSSESVPTARSEKEVQCHITEELKNLTLDNSHILEECKLPAQTILQIDHVYPATVMSTDGISFWVITDEVNEVLDLMTSMTNYYKENIVEISEEQLKMLTYCAVYDKSTDCFYRVFLVNLKDMGQAEVFLVDTGETRQTSPSNMQPLYPRFCKKPPYARCCHLAGIDLLDPLNKDLIEKQETLLKDLMGDPCHIKIDDNSSESLDVYLIYSSGEVLNDLLVQKDQILPVPESSETAKGLPELNEENLNITQNPEYDDPVEAVTGYRYRDEIDICKHYKGGPNKTCFKGSRCTKRHVRKHPDGWTLDRVCVAARCGARALPAPGAWRRVTVTCVAHFDRFYVHLVDDAPVEEAIPRFGVVLPPTTLDALILDMNSEATRAAYKRLQLVPAPGELVAALYSDEKWYRARVLTSTRADQNVEVMYIDYGQVFWVKEDAIAELEPRFCVLEVQAIRCVLAGVEPRTQDMKQWAEAKLALTRLIQEQTLNMHVIYQEYDEVVVELFDDSEYSISEQLAAGEYITLVPYSSVQEKGGNTKIVVP